MQKITPFFWFNNQVEEAINLYTSVFKDAKITNVSRYGDAGPGPKGSVMTASFVIQGQEFMALNGNSYFDFTPSVSMFVSCEDQQEVDELWEKLSEGGEPSRCGWLKDKFGVSWQIIPKALGRLMHQTDPATSARVMQAMMKMGKIIISDLEKAAAG